MRCHKVQGMTETFTDTLYSRAERAVQFTKKPYLPLFLSETADKFVKGYAIKKSFRHALHLVTVHLHRQNQVAHALHTRDFWLAKLSIHFPIHFARRAHIYPITLSCLVTLGSKDIEQLTPNNKAFDQYKEVVSVQPT